MTNRREILLAAAAATAAATATATPMARASQAPHGRPARLAAVVVDRRFAESRAFGRQMAQRGERVLEIEADVTDLWLNEIQPLWSREPVPIAGLTARSALFCLERLAWGRRLRVVYHAEHTPRRDGGFDHRILARAAGRLATDYSSAGAEWPAMAAVVLAGDVWATTAVGPTPAGLAPAHEAGTETLASFVIAPVAKS